MAKKKPDFKGRISVLKTKGKDLAVKAKEVKKAFAAKKAEKKKKK